VLCSYFSLDLEGQGWMTVVVPRPLPQAQRNKSKVCDPTESCLRMWLVERASLSGFISQLWGGEVAVFTIVPAPRLPGTGPWPHL
jgi:hypothetical protein